MRPPSVVAALLSVGLLIATAPATATPLGNIDGIGTETGYLLWVPSDAPRVFSMTHDVAAGRSTSLRQGAWDYTP